LDASGSTRQPMYNPFRGAALRHLAARARRQTISAFEPLILLHSPLTNFGWTPCTKCNLRKFGRGIKSPHQNCKIGRGIPSPRCGAGIGNALFGRHCFQDYNPNLYHIFTQSLRCWRHEPVLFTTTDNPASVSSHKKRTLWRLSLSRLLILSA